jgi:C-terminal processing protease CtpA/Prc
VTDKKISYYSDTVLIDDRIAVMRIKSFFYDYLANDSLRITSLLEKIQDYNYLLIDIQENSGGSQNYWKYIAGKLSETPVVFTRTQAAKGGSLNKHFYPEIESWQIATKQNTFFSDTPYEIYDGSYYINSTLDTVLPNNPIPFKGEIYVLVSNRVVSASEDFAFFCKTSGWATVAGIRTMGDGNCGEPTLFSLPNSGITLVHPSLVGLNDDGSFNFETRTMPDIEIFARNSDERLEKLIQYIKNK